MMEPPSAPGKVDFSDPKFAIRRRARRLTDHGARWAIGMGGVSVIIAIMLIFLYLLTEVMPLFSGASMHREAYYAVPAEDGDGATALLAMEEQAEVGLRVTEKGNAVFFNTRTGDIIKQESVRIPEGRTVTSFASGTPTSGLFAFGLSDGSVVVLRHDYKITYPDDKRLITPLLKYPFGEDPLLVSQTGKSLANLTIRDGDTSLMLAGSTADGKLEVMRFKKEENFITEEIMLKPEPVELPSVSGEITSILIDIRQEWMFVGSGKQQLNVYNLRDPGGGLHSQIDLTDGTSVSTIDYLLGGISLLVGEDNGQVSQWFLVRDEANQWQLQKIRSFEKTADQVIQIETEQRRKGFAVAGNDGAVSIYNATAQRTVLTQQVTDSKIKRVAMSPRANALLVLDDKQQLGFWRVENEHPEISWSVLWGKVWYESYEEPDYVWQSSASSNDFEPKLSLMPLTFGTLKAAFYAMLLAAPLAICGAIFTAYFMAPTMRRKVKPVVELMEALPTVILGFLAGLWLAPFVEHNLPGIFSLLVLTPVAIVLMSFVWVQLPARIRLAVPDGWEAALLIPVIIVTAWFCLGMSETIEAAFFNGDMRTWLNLEMGIDFDQRNALIVGLAMGFAVIPTIFSIAEDAIFSVPKHLSNGSLALGATPWQTLMRVVLLTASPGIFSAVMIGFGRAVGETMIVLMATGNTPIMDWNIFEGMRTLAANIATEMPESEVGSTHFRVLFLAAFVLFMFTFVVNTVAEIVRQRLRIRYGSL